MTLKNPSQPVGFPYLGMRRTVHAQRPEGRSLPTAPPKTRPRQREMPRGVRTPRAEAAQGAAPGIVRERRVLLGCFGGSRSQNSGVSLQKVGLDSSKMVWSGGCGSVRAG